eukprot:jgi/Chrzof1/11956/Cz06g16010.t1
MEPGKPMPHADSRTSASTWEVPALCGDPKNKLSKHRRGNRRRIYYEKYRETLAACQYCGRAFLPHLYAPGGKGCTGQCLPQPHTTYPEEYKPPC